MDPCSEIYADKGLGFVTVAAGPDAFLPARALWYNVEKGFGIVAADRGGKDVFVHATTLRVRPGTSSRITKFSEHETD
jgi:cold shock CspA family protein